MPIRTFVPQDIALDDWPQLEPLYQNLLDRSLEDADAVEAWLADYSELTAAVSEHSARTRIDQACHTDDVELERRFLHFVETIAPKLKPVSFKLQRKLLDSGHLDELKRRSPERFELIEREWRAEVELFREANIPLATRVTKLVSEYDKINGRMTVDYDGQTLTLQQLARYGEEADRTVRETTWRLASDLRLEQRDTIDNIFAQLIDLRSQIAVNAEMPSYRDYAFKSFGRFDYGPGECHEFADAIEEVCVPLVRELDRHRRKSLGVQTLRPWDAAVDIEGRDPLRPFDADSPDDLLNKSRRIFLELSPELGEDFARLEMRRNLDLESRPHKRGGGFQSSLEESGEPFIFMNAAGLQRDVETMLHEAGHAFHFIWATRKEPLVFLRHAPMEFCEVASMAMELIAMPRIDVFYGDSIGNGETSEEKVARARRNHLEGIVRFFPWMATIDQYQHWLYTHPGHTRDERLDAWLAVLDRFGSDAVDWTGLEGARRWMWQRQLHLFHHPFYYVEYGIAQLGALQLWVHHREDAAGTLRKYREALSLGGTRKLPELFDAAGIRFDFSRATLEPLMQAVGDALRP